MFQLTFVHILMFFVVHMVRRKKQSLQTKQEVDTKDLIRRSFEETIKVKDAMREHLWFHLLLTILPAYLYLQQPLIAEHICVLYIYHVCIRTIQNKINPQNTLVDFHLPFFVLSLLVSVQHGQISRTHVPHAYIAMLLYSFYHLYAKPDVTTTTSIVNDTVLAHLLFFVFRSS